MKLYRWIWLLGLCVGCASVYKDERVEQVPAADYLAMLDSLSQVQLLDIRTPPEYRRSHLPGAVNINYLSLSFERRVDTLDRSLPTFIYCHTAHRSPLVARHLLEAGFEQVIDLEGGYRAYQKYAAGQDSIPKDE